MCTANTICRWKRELVQTRFYMSLQYVYSNGERKCSVSFPCNSGLLSVCFPAYVTSCQCVFLSVCAPVSVCSCLCVLLSFCVLVSVCSCQCVSLSVCVPVSVRSCQCVFLSECVPVCVCSCQWVLLSVYAPVRVCSCLCVLLSVSNPVSVCSCQCVLLWCVCVLQWKLKTQSCGWYPNAGSKLNFFNIFLKMYILVCVYFIINRFGTFTSGIFSAIRQNFWIT